MSGERGPTTEELRARVLAAEARTAPHPCQRCGSETWTDVDYSGCSDCREPPEHDCAVEGCVAVRDYAGPLPEGRTFYDPANPPPQLDKEKGERLGSPPH